MKWLEEILANEEEDKLSAIKKELPLHFIPKEKYNEQADKLKEKESELTATVTKLEEMNSKIEGLSGSAEEKEKLQEQLESMKTEYEQFKADADNRVATIKKRQAVERGLRDANANPDTIDMLVDKFNLDEIELDADDKVKEFDKHLAPLKESRKSLFGESQYSGDKPVNALSGDVKPELAQLEDRLAKASTNSERIALKNQIFELQKLKE